MSVSRYCTRQLMCTYYVESWDQYQGSVSNVNDVLNRFKVIIKNDIHHKCQLSNEGLFAHIYHSFNPANIHTDI